MGGYKWLKDERENVMTKESQALLWPQAIFNCLKQYREWTHDVYVSNDKEEHKVQHFSPSTIYYAKVFLKGLPEAGSAKMSVRKTQNLEWEAENDIERNSVRQMYKEIHDLSSIKFPN